MICRSGSIFSYLFSTFFYNYFIILSINIYVLQFMMKNGEMLNKLLLVWFTLVYADNEVSLREGVKNT